MPQRPSLPLADLSERDLTLQAIGTQANPGVARQLGWLCYHVLRSRGSAPGFPDWTLVRDRVLFLELKTERGRPSEAQKHWIGALLNAGAEVYLVRPSHLDALARILSCHGSPYDRRGGLPDLAAGLRAETREAVS